MTPWGHPYYGGFSMDLTQTSSTYPAVDEINALPEKVRRYIHDLETRISTEGNALNILELANERDALRWRVEELEAQLQLHRRVEQLEAQVALLTHPSRIAVVFDSLRFGNGSARALP
jgi:hypothetical protein